MKSTWEIFAFRVSFHTAEIPEKCLTRVWVFIDPNAEC
jgi:hypothetical protein